MRTTSGSATVLRRIPLHHPGGARPDLDRSGHVRAASGLCWLGPVERARLVVAQDDTSNVAMLDETGAVIGSIALAHEVEGRRIFEARLGNKHEKLDLEACARLPDGRALLVGSGSLPARERMVVVSERGAKVCALPGLYAALRGQPRFSGSELNVEGATVVGGRLWLANRGNGAASGALRPVDALTSLSVDELLAHLEGRGPVPTLGTVREFDLGTVEGVRLTFTDLCARGDQLYFLASAEASPNAVDDGLVVGAAVGRIDGDQVRLARLCDERGQPLRDKVEGLAWGRPDGLGEEVWVVVDRDDPDVASELLRVLLPPDLTAVAGELTAQ